MSDIFREVEEDVRRERLEKLWKQYGDYIIAAVAAIVVGVAGYKLWQHYEAQQLAKASVSYSAAIDLSNRGKNDDAAQAFAKIVQGAPAGYATIAKLGEADALLASGKSADAVALYKSIADKDSSELGELARIRAAWALADKSPKSELQDLLSPLLVDKSSWRFMAREILAFCDYRDKSMMAAENEYQSLAKDTAAPATLRERASAMVSLIRAGGTSNYGTVPPLPKPETPAPGAAP